MSSRDRDTKSLQDKLKVFFKKGGIASLPAKNELIVTPDIEKELSTETPLHRRSRAIKDIGDKALHIRIQEGGAEKIWICTRDLLYDSNVEIRHMGLALWRNVAEGQADYLLMMRTILFLYLRDTHLTHAPEDSLARFKLLHTLTNTGKNITCLEEQIGSLLLEWLPQIQSPTLLVEFLQLITNVVKFNATYLDEDIVHGIVKEACSVCVGCACVGAVVAALALLEAVVSYSLVPRGALGTLVAALCRTVNLDTYCQNSWKLMRYVVGGDLGPAAVQEMVAILEEGGGADAGLVRGAVFHMNTALWSPRRVLTLKVSYLTVLPAFLQAVLGGQPVVTYEVVLALQALLVRAPHELHDVAWDVFFRILRALIDHTRSLEPANELLHSRLHALISSLEQLQEAGQYTGDANALLDLVDYCGHDRPEASAMRLVSLRCGSLSGDAAGVAGAMALADKYLRRDPRPSLRLHTLAHLHSYIKRNSVLHTEEMVEGVALPALSAAAADGEPAVRAAAARVLADLASTSPGDVCPDLLDLLENILNRPFETYGVDATPPAGGGPEGDWSDVRLAAAGLVSVGCARLLRPPPAHALRCLLVLLDHLDLHYKRPHVFQHHPDIRLKIFELLFRLRVNAFNHVGLCPEGAAAGGGGGSVRVRPLFSPYLMAEPAAPRGPAPPHKDLPQGCVLVPGSRVSRLVCSALSRECDWRVLGPLLRALPAHLHARALPTGRRAVDVDMLATTLLAMISEPRTSTECMRAGAAGAASGAHKPSVSELQAAALLALAALAPHHTYLEAHTQQRIVQCLLKYGMVQRSAVPYLCALTVWTLEARDAMVTMLPQVLLDLSKVSDTQAIASPMLEFLSTLTRLPRVFASFVEDQYMSVFAILLPYTNPSRYNHYVVSLAHHVVAAWFLKCRLPYRRNFVPFIIQGLHNYIIMPFEEQLQYRGARHAPLNEDSSARKRSSSLGAKGVRRVGVGGVRSGGGGAADGSSAAFHVELTETCLDLLARYAFTPCSVKPHRSDTAQFIFSGGQSTTWLVGHKLVTITTSGCLQNTLKQGLCERCAVLCRQHAESAPDEQDDAPPPPAPPAPAPAAPQVQVGEQPGAEPSAPPEVKRQNSSENPSNNAGVDVGQVPQRQDGAAPDAEDEERWSAAALAAAGACPCWCAHWAEVHVRTPTGDVSWVMRVQNQMSWDYLLESPLQDVLAMLSPTPRTAAPPSSASSGLGDSRQDVSAESEPGARSASARALPAAPRRDLHKSSSDSVVAGEKRAPLAFTHCIGPPQPQPQPLRASTQPINIPSSPQRQSSSSTTDDDDALLILPEGKSRHPVRRSNSSPEMSSSWKVPGGGGGAGGGEYGDDGSPVDVLSDADCGLILLPSCEPTCSGSVSAGLHLTKKAQKKNEMRVSCEAIPEEMCGSSPLTHHPHLMTYNSDPGTSSASSEAPVETAVEAGAALPAHPLPALPPAHAPSPAPAPVHLQKVSSDSAVEAGPGKAQAGAGGARGGDDLPPLQRSKRSNTISVMSPTRRNRDSVAGRTGGGGGGGAGVGGAGGAGAGGGGGVTPSFVLLQLYHNMSTYPDTPPVPGEPPTLPNPLVERPLKVVGVQHERTLKNLDLVPPLETYKVGVLYVGAGQHDNEDAILRNEYGSVRYSEFLSQLGTLVSLDGEAPGPPDLFLNLEMGGKDGRYTYVWHEDIMQVLFHVATAMPTSASDPTCNEKRKYIGNDLVSIVYNDSGQEFNIHTIKGQFNLCIVVVEPCDHGISRVCVRTKDERVRSTFLPHLEPQTVSDHNVPLLARQHALHAALASQISKSLNIGGLPYASNSLERLRHIKRLRRRLEAERLAAAETPRPYADTADLARRAAIDDFNDYT